MYFPESGMTPEHFNVFTSVAQDVWRIIIVRDTNVQSTPWIAKGFPGKPFEIKAKTDKETGFVTATKSDDFTQAYAHGFYVVDASGVPVNASGRRLDGPHDWPIAAGQIVHPEQHLPLVGDYDLLAVIDPGSRGRNLVLVTHNYGDLIKNLENPDVRRVRDVLNQRMDQPRVMHGAQDQFSSHEDEKDEGVTAFYPDRVPQHIDNSDGITELYQDMGRQPLALKKYYMK